MQLVPTQRPSSQASMSHWKRDIERQISLRLRRFSRDDREDVVQDVWVDVLAEYAAGEPPTERRLQTIVERHVKRLKRSVVRRSRSESTSTCEETFAYQLGRSDLHHHRPQLQARPDHVLRAQELIHQSVAGLSAALTDQQLRVLACRVGQSASVAESAQTLKVSEDVVKNELSRGLRRLKSQIQGKIGGDEESMAVMHLTAAALLQHLSASDH